MRRWRNASADAAFPFLPQSPSKPGMDSYRPTSDWLFYFLCGLFACLTSFLPSLSGRYWILLGAQGIGLWAFTALAVRYGPPGRHVLVLLLWLAVQVLTLAVAGRWNLPAVEGTIPHGFDLHRQWLERYHTAAGPWPALRADGGSRWPAAAATLGAGLTGGLTGSLYAAHAGNVLALGLSVFWVDIPESGLGAWARYGVRVAPLAQVGWALGLIGLHLGLTPWLWRYRAPAPYAWRRQKSLLLASGIISLVSLGALWWPRAG